MIVLFYSFCRNLLLELKVGLITSISMDLNSVIHYIMVMFVPEFSLEFYYSLLTAQKFY